MKRNILYRQCRLVKKIRDGEMIQTSYIPEEFAKYARVVKLRDEDGAWDDGWVIRVVGNALSEEQLTRLDEAHHKFQRQTEA